MESELVHSVRSQRSPCCQFAGRVCRYGQSYAAALNTSHVGIKYWCRRQRPGRTQQYGWRQNAVMCKETAFSFPRRHNAVSSFSLCAIAAPRAGCFISGGECGMTQFKYNTAANEVWIIFAVITHNDFVDDVTDAQKGACVVMWSCILFIPADVASRHTYPRSVSLA